VRQGALLPAAASYRDSALCALGHVLCRVAAALRYTAWAERVARRVLSIRMVDGRVHCCMPLPVRLLPPEARHEEDAPVLTTAVLWCRCSYQAVPSGHQPDPPDVEAEADQEHEGALPADLKPFTAANVHLEAAPPARLSLPQMMAKVGPMS
jgi:hypothetical protein